MQPALQTESRTLVSGTLRSAWRKPRVDRLDHQNASLAGCAHRGVVTSGAEPAAAGPHPTVSRAEGWVSVASGLFGDGTHSLLLSRTCPQE